MASYLRYFFDNEQSQRDDIDKALFSGEIALENTEQLQKQVRAQRAQIRDLSALVSVLVKMLGEAGTLDPKILEYRMEAELEARADAASVANEMATCTKCGETVKAVYTTLTADGVICDRCMARG